MRVCECMSVGEGVWTISVSDGVTLGMMREYGILSLCYGV